MNRRTLKKTRAKLAEIERLHDGVLRPSDVLAEARNPNSVLHRCFEWDDKKAAERHRLAQARELIASVRYVYVVDGRKFSAPQYVRNPAAETREQGYVGLPRLRSDAELAIEALRSEFARADAHLNRARELAGALEYDEAGIAAVRREVGAIRKRVSLFDEVSSD